MESNEQLAKDAFIRLRDAVIEFLPVLSSAGLQMDFISALKYTQKGKINAQCIAIADDIAQELDGIAARLSQCLPAAEKLHDGEIRDELEAVASRKPPLHSASFHSEAIAAATAVLSAIHVASPALRNQDAHEFLVLSPEQGIRDSVRRIDQPLSRVRGIEPDIRRECGAARDTAASRGTDEFMPPAWFYKHFNIPTERLRKAKSQRRIRAVPRGKQSLYSVADARRLWPEKFSTPVVPRWQLHSVNKREVA